MNSETVLVARATWVSIRALLLLTLLLGVVYSLAVTGVGQLLLPAQANGSMLKDSQGNVVASKLIGQNYLDSKGSPLDRYFQPRPSAAGDGYDGSASSGSNLGPANDKLSTAINERRAQVAAFNGVKAEQVPSDALTASSSGLDPDISPAYAAIQVRRVAEARGLETSSVTDLVAKYTSGKTLGYLGESRVNVVELNTALDSLGGR